MLTLVLLGGCGQSGKVAVYPASGTVTIDGKAPGASKIVLQPKDGEAKYPPAGGIVSQDGEFQLQSYGKNDGVAEGEYNVLLVSDPMTMVPIPATKPFVIEISRDASGKIAPLTIELESVKGAKATIGAPLPSSTVKAPGVP